MPAMASFSRKIGVTRTFSAGTQDCSNKFAAGEAVFGTTTLHPVPDIDHTDYLLIIGENPKISHMSFLSISDAMSKLKAEKKRGTVIQYVNPREIESADGTGAVIQIKPEADLYFLAALLHEIERTGGFREDVISAHGKNIDGLKAFIRSYSPARVEKVVGIPENVIREVADRFSKAKRAAVHMSTGANMGRQGTLTYWLVQMLSFVTGNLDKKGVRYFILESERENTGCSAMESAGSGLFYLERLAVLPENRNKGFGRMLVEHIFHEAWSMGCQNIRIGIISKQSELKKWYSKIGFKKGITKTFDHLPFEVTFMDMPC